MARLYSRKKGKSGSTQPLSTISPDWVEYSAKEIEELVVSLHNNGLSQAMIGTVLRDQYGVPNIKRITGKTVKEILKKHKLAGEIPEDLLNLIKTSVKLFNHMKENKKDMSAKRGYQLAVSKIRRLAKYYKSEKVLSKDWRYSSEKAALLVK
ncbi:MAG: 30S ribosomal protein S15 [archaeon]